MKIEDYPLATSIEDTDLMILETANGTKKIDIEGLKSLLKVGIAYEPGDLYFSYDPTSPAEKFGGSWVQLTDVYLRAADNTATGGSDTVTLTAAQMPSHQHGMQMHKSSAENSNFGLQAGSSAFAGSVMVYRVYGSGFDTYSSGSSEAHSVMPAYQNIYIWRKIEDVIS